MYEHVESTHAEQKRSIRRMKCNVVVTFGTKTIASCIWKNKTCLIRGQIENQEINKFKKGKQATLWNDTPENSRNLKRDVYWLNRFSRSIISKCD